MSQYIALADIIPNKARRPVPLDAIQPAYAPLQTALRPAELDPPQVNGVRFKTDMVRLTCIGEALNGQERNQHIVT